MAHPELHCNLSDPTNINGDFFAYLDELSREMTIQPGETDSDFEIVVEEDIHRSMIEKLVIMHTRNELRQLFHMTKREERKTDRCILQISERTRKYQAIKKKRRTIIYRMLLVLMKETYRQAYSQAKEEERDTME